METTHRWHPLVRDWLRDFKAADKAAKTLETYGSSTRQFIDWVDTQPDPPHDVTELGKNHVADWLIYLIEHTSRGNANTRYRGLRQWFNWLLNQEEIATHPMARLTPPAPSDDPPPIVPDNLMRKVLDQCSGRDVISRRDTALIRLIWDTGARLSEVAALTTDDLDLDLDVINVVGKGRRPRAIPFSPKTGQAISRYLRLRQADRYASSDKLWLGEKNRGPLTPNGIKQMLRRRGRAAGISEALGRNLHAHLGRHYMAHHAQAAGMSEGDLMLLAGWRSPQMPKRYGQRGDRTSARRRAPDATRRPPVGDNRTPR